MHKSEETDFDRFGNIGSVTAAVTVFFGDKIKTNQTTKQLHFIAAILFTVVSEISVTTNAGKHSHYIDKQSAFTRLISEKRCVKKKVLTLYFTVQTTFIAKQCFTKRLYIYI